ncbi:Hypothetical_protein [Hexamita inflata]|uniref:Hypothetical_protein n=1 Tax=Hexamita inflata TaxID=28002 RepID=A0AA86V290_9EUKA|nr:Hypothetical protein HINF_LOCUS65534 [Hexamita inflata]
MNTQKYAFKQIILALKIKKLLRRHFCKQKLIEWISETKDLLSSVRFHNEHSIKTVFINWQREHRITYYQDDQADHYNRIEQQILKRNLEFKKRVVLKFMNRRVEYLLRFKPDIEPVLSDIMKTNPGYAFVYFQRNYMRFITSTTGHRIMPAVAQIQKSHHQIKQTGYTQPGTQNIRRQIRNHIFVESNRKTIYAQIKV